MTLTVDTLNIDTTTKDVRRDKDTLLECLELLVALDSLGLGQSGVNADRGEIALAKELVQLSGAVDRLDEDTDLIELQGVEQIVQFAVLCCLLQLDVVLLQTVQGKLSLVINVDFQRLQRRTVSIHTVQDASRSLAFCMNFLQVTRISFDSVALNIMTCLVPEIARKISCTSLRMSALKVIIYSNYTKYGRHLPTVSSSLSHSSRTKCLTLAAFSDLSRTSEFKRPGVATMICGHVSLDLRISVSAFWLVPP